MDASTYAVEAEIEATHWWFVERRALLVRMIRSLGLGDNARVLDIGTSTGTNLRMLRDQGFTRFTGVDLSEDAIRWCAEKGLGEVRQGDVCALPLPDASFDLVLATDIIEHVDRDDIALKEIARVLRPGGHALLTVPAFESIRGLQDRVAHHKRRYLKHQLLERVQQAGLVPGRAFYFNSLLFVPIWLARRLIDLLRLPLASEGEVNSPWINAVLLRIFALDTRLAQTGMFPFGVSILAVASKPA